MADVDSSTADPFEAATAAAVEDILAAIGADEPVGPEQGVALTSGEAVGHGVIRLRDPASAPARDSGPAGAGSGSAAAAESVGHGTIRLRG